MACGQIIGLFLNGIVSERYGYRKTLMACLSATVGFVFILFFAPNISTLVAGELLMGIPLGVYQTLTVTYASEVCPVSLRAYLTTYVNLCWVFGQLIASGVLKGLATRTDQWAYRIPFAIQWVWPVPIFIGVYLAPESPWWLVRKDRREDAVKSLKRLTKANSPGFSAEETVSMIIYTNALEKRVETGTSYLDCFKGIDRRRTEIACCVWAAQSLCGAGLMGYSTIFYQRAGLAVSQSFTMSLAIRHRGNWDTRFMDIDDLLRSTHTLRRGVRPSNSRPASNRLRVNCTIDIGDILGDGLDATCLYIHLRLDCWTGLFLTCI
jgi:SP family general alpha glucoside:H+ symporter-like MFS transporter